MKVVVSSPPLKTITEFGVTLVPVTIILTPARADHNGVGLRLETTGGSGHSEGVNEYQ